jgi:hypothetical protein
MLRRGRRGALFGIVSLVAAACARGTAALVVVSEVQSIGAWLREQLANIESGAKGRDRGVDARLRACSSSLDVFEIAIARAAQVEDREIRELLAPFFDRYGELVAELDAEGMRRDGQIVDDAGAELAPAPPRVELELVTFERLRAARMQ